MTTMLLAPAAAAPIARPDVETVLARAGLSRHIVPAAGASVMGTGIVGIAAHTLPVHVVGLGVLAEACWLLAGALLVSVLALNAVQWLRFPQVAQAHLTDRRTAPALGTMAMAFLTVGTATLLIGPPWLGATPARTVDAVLFGVGTAVGLATTVGLPVLLITRGDHGGHPDVAATWLLPVVPPMVSAAAGALLAARLAPGAGRNTLIVGCLMLFGLSLLAVVLMLSLLWARLLLHGREPAAATPSVWLVLGPLGQGATALGAIAVAANHSLPAPYPAGLAVLALGGGAMLLGFAGLWAAVATVLTIRAGRAMAPFHLGWWSFTFPVGTCVTGLSSLAARVDVPALKVLAVAAFAALLVAWVVVALGTARGVRRGSLLSPLRALRSATLDPPRSIHPARSTPPDPPSLIRRARPAPAPPSPDAS